MHANMDRPADRHGAEINHPRANYILGLVTFAFCMAYVDRQLLNLLVEPIKASLRISDTAFSLVQGTAFVTAYLAASPIFGRLVDVASRRNIIIFGVCAWSLFTALSGLCESYGQLFLARMGVGLTEASIFPAAWSLIGDCFSPKRQPRAFSVFMIGAQLGGGFSLIAGGMIVAFAATLTTSVPLLAALEPWQMAFVVTGVPGFVFVLVLLTMKEPSRTRNPHAGDDQGRLTLAQVGAGLWRGRRLYWRMYLATGTVGIVQLAIPSWFPAFMIRAHGLSAAETGLKLGLTSALIGPASTLLGPFVADWLSRRGYADAPVRAAAWCTVPMVFFSLLIPVSAAPAGAFAAAAGVIFCCGFPVGLMAASTQMATPSRMRGVVASIYTLMAQLIGYMIGPTLVALLTDRVFGDPAMVGHSMQIVMSAAAVVASFCLFTAMTHYRRALSGSTDETGSAAGTQIHLAPRHGVAIAER
jgi:MFS family permease